MAYVIVGASLAGANAAETLRTEGFSGDIVMIGDDPQPPYERPPLSKGYLLGGQELDAAFVHPLDWYREQRIDLRLGTSVTAIDPATQTVTLSTGDTVAYEKLLLATGARPRPLDLAGDVRYLRDMADSRALKDALKPGVHLVVIGAGWIGLEVAAAARSHGAHVTVVETDSLPLRRALGDEVAAIYRDLHLSQGVQFHFGRSVASFADRVVTLDDGTTIAADLVVAGVGVTPATELAEQAGLAVDNGVLVDESLRTSDPHIYACGDAARWDNPLTGTRMRVEHWENARQSAMAAARAMLGQPVRYDWIPYFFSDQYDLGMEYSGWIGPDGYDQVVFRGDPASREFLAFWVKDGRVLAAMNANIWDVHDDVRALVLAGHAGKAADTAALADPGTPLSKALA